MAETFRRSRLERFIRQLEARADVYKNNPADSFGHDRYEALQEVIAELKHEFMLEGVFGITNTELIIQALDGSVLCDDCLSEKSGVKPRNAVNQYCRRMSDTIERHTRKPCDECKNMHRRNKFVNELIK